MINSRFEDRCSYNRQNKNGGCGTIERTVYVDKDVEFVDTSTITSKINLKNMKKTKTRHQINEDARDYYDKNKLKINQRSKQLRERRDTEQRLYKYGFFTLLTIILAHLILIQF